MLIFFRFYTKEKASVFLPRLLNFHFTSSEATISPLPTGNLTNGFIPEMDMFSFRNFSTKKSPKFAFEAS
ncbi:MAG: hypothetical protein CFE22_17805 [Cytophagaceae bacterium BCCC1]|nr:MAG: hypothetical protein CFE22_17805 [Cytophagaceae bacterium BCCC1]